MPIGPCETCVFWIVDPKEPRGGVCCRYPPQVAVLSTNQAGVIGQNATVRFLLPAVAGDFACGEHQLKGDGHELDGEAAKAETAMGEAEENTGRA